MSAKWNSRMSGVISSPPIPPGTPFASHRVNTCRSGSQIPAKAEPLGHLHGREAVRHQTALDRLAAGDDEIGGKPKSRQRRTAGTDVAQREPHQGQPRQVDSEAVTPNAMSSPNQLATSGVSATQPTHASVIT